jgi:hypothetical protein
MPIRTFASMAIQSSTVPQPLVGSWATAGLGAASTIPIVVTLGTQTVTPNVDATSIFTVGDHALLIDPAGTNVEDVFISAVAANTVTIGVQNQTGVATRFAHASGAFGTGCFISLKAAFNNLYLQIEDGDTGPFYLGNAFNMTATFRRIVKIRAVAAGAQAIDFGSTMGFGGNPYDLSELWALGIITDKYSVALPTL